MNTVPPGFNQGIYNNFSYFQTVSNFQTKDIRPAMALKSLWKNLKFEPKLNFHAVLGEIMGNLASSTMGNCKGSCTSQSG